MHSFQGVVQNELVLVKKRGFQKKNAPFLGEFRLYLIVAA